MVSISLNLPKGDTFTLCNGCRIDAEPQKRANEMKVTRVYSPLFSLFFFTPHQDVIMRFSFFFKCLYDGNSSIQFWLLEFVVLQNQLVADFAKVSLILASLEIQRGENTLRQIDANSISSFTGALGELLTTIFFHFYHGTVLVEKYAICLLQSAAKMQKIWLRLAKTAATLQILNC